MSRVNLVVKTCGFFRPIQKVDISTLISNLYFLGANVQKTDIIVSGTQGVVLDFRGIFSVGFLVH